MAISSRLLFVVLGNFNPLISHCSQSLDLLYVELIARQYQIWCP